MFSIIGKVDASTPRRPIACHVLAQVLITALLSLLAPIAMAETQFKNATIEMIVASDAGGGTDLIGRLFARYLEKYLPDNPKIVVKAMGGGAKKILAANHLMRAKPDGLTMMQTDSDLLQATLLKRESVMFEPKDFRVVGSISRGGSIVMIRKDAVPRLKDPSARPVLVGATNGERSWLAMLVWGKEFLNWNLDWIKGHKGTGDLTLALQRAEVDVFATNGLNVIEPLYKDAFVDLLVQEGQASGGTFVPRDTFKQVPVFPLLLKDAKAPEIAFRGYRSVMGASEIDKWIALPPKTLDEIVAVYRAAFDKSVGDPEFLTAAHKQISEEVYVTNGADSEQAIRELRETPPEATRYAEQLRQKHNLLPKN